MFVIAKNRRDQQSDFRRQGCSGARQCDLWFPVREGSERPCVKAKRRVLVNTSEVMPGGFISQCGFLIPTNGSTGDAKSGWCGATSFFNATLAATYGFRNAIAPLCYAWNGNRTKGHCAEHGVCLKKPSAQWSVPLHEISLFPVGPKAGPRPQSVQALVSESFGEAGTAAEETLLK